MKRVKVLIHQGTIPHYRIPVFNAIAQKCDLTIAYETGTVSENAQFKTIHIQKKRRIPKMGYLILDSEFRKALDENDVAIHMLMSGVLNFTYLKYWHKRIKAVTWGIGVPASYNIRYDDPGVKSSCYLKMVQNADAALFYSEYPKKKYSRLGINSDKMFVANNTVAIDEASAKDLGRDRDIILFVGSLYKQKKIEVLLDSYWIAYQENLNLPELVLVGDGDQKEAIEQWTQEHHLENKITLTGGIYEECILAGYFKRAIMCISPDQAGLSVLKSMGYGVPYVTHKNAITGGEIFNIHNGIDGVLMDDFTELPNILLGSITEKDKYLEMGRMAQEYYFKSRTIDQMAQGFLDAIKYVMQR